MREFSRQSIGQICQLPDTVGAAASPLSGLLLVILLSAAAGSTSYHTVKVLSHFLYTTATRRMTSYVSINSVKYHEVEMLFSCISPWIFNNTFFALIQQIQSTKVVFNYFYILIIVRDSSLQYHNSVCFILIVSR